MFRWCRISVWLILLVAVSFVAYFHLIGLPEFLKQPLLERLLASDIAAQFSNMQLGWRRGPSIIIDNVSFSRPDQPLSPSLTASRAELALDWKALLRARLHGRSLQVVNAQWRLPVSETPGDALLLSGVTLDMRFDTNDIVRLETCRGLFRGMQIDIVGNVTHVKDLRKWTVFAGTAAGATGVFQARLKEFARVVQEIHFTGTPILSIESGADGLDVNSFHAEMNFGALAADSPWGLVTNLHVTAACARLADPGARPFLHASGHAERLDTQWAHGRRISFSTSVTKLANSNLNANLRLDAADFKAPLTQGGNETFAAGHFSWNGNLTLAASNRAPFNAAGKLRVDNLSTPWGSADRVILTGQGALATNAPLSDSAWGVWTEFVPWDIDCVADLTNVTNPKLHLDRLAFNSHWRAPQLTIERLRGELYGGQMEANLRLDIASRELRCSGKADFDPHSVSQLLRRPDREWLDQLEFKSPPNVTAVLRVVLPPWTNRPADWASDVESSLQIAGNFASGAAAFDKVPVQSATGHFAFTNLTWHITQLHAVRPGGDVEMDYTTSPDRFHYIIDSKMDPKAALPLVAPDRPGLLDDFDFHSPPEVHAQIWGSWRDPSQLGVTGTVQAGDFTFRGEPIAALSASVNYTNLLLDVRDFRLSNALCRASAPWVRADFAVNTVWLTNATGFVDPRFVRDLLQPNAPDWLDAVRFDEPPSVSASGSFYLTNGREANLHFLVNGKKVHYAKLMADRGSASVDWVGPNVTITNITGSFYRNGTLAGWLVFPGGLRNGPDFQADFTARDVDISALSTGFTGKTNKLEGRIDADLSLVGPGGTNRNDWQGRGHVHVHDALLWDIKVFGIFSPVLNLISSGWGHSRAKEAAADFIVTNGIVSSDNVVVRCQGFRILMRGTLDEKQRINSRLEARLSRDTPLVGSFLSAAFLPLSKMFEYHVSGPVNDPVMEPIYVPKFIMFMLRPFHSIKSLAEPDSTKAKDAK